MENSKEPEKPREGKQKDKQIAKCVKNLSELHKMQAAVIRKLQKLT